MYLLLVGVFCGDEMWGSQAAQTFSATIWECSGAMSLIVAFCVSSSTVKTTRADMWSTRSWPDFNKSGEAKQAVISFERVSSAILVGDPCRVESGIGDRDAFASRACLVAYWVPLTKAPMSFTSLSPASLTRTSTLPRRFW